MAAVFAGAAFIVVPEIEHGLAEVVYDIGAIEIDVLHEGAAIVAVKNDVLVFAGGPPPLHHDANGIGRTDRRVGDIWRNEESLTLADQMIDDPVAFADPDFDVTLELIKIFLRIDEVKIVSSVRSLDDHDEKIATIVEVTITDRRLEEVAVRLNPRVNVDRRRDFCGRTAADVW